jgi:3-hydroxybutyryl-CoA dehydratase
MKYKIGDNYSKSFKVTEKMINEFALITGDINPVHLDENFAQRTIFKKRISHGFLIGSFISAVLGNYFPGNGTIYLSQTMKFLKPVFINDLIKVYLEVIEITDRDWLVIKTECFNETDKLVLTGEAKVIPKC